jgi:hypothetical protein
LGNDENDEAKIEEAESEGKFAVAQWYYVRA